MTSFGYSKEAVEKLITGIQNETETSVHVTDGKNAYFAYCYPLPQLSARPLAHVLMLIPVSEVTPLMDTLLINSNGEAAVFDASGKEIYRMGNVEDELSLGTYSLDGSSEENYAAPSGRKYVLQRVVAESNGWIYVSAIRQSDTLSGMANKQLVLILLLLLILFVAVAAMLAIIIRQYRPISKLAEQVVGVSSQGSSEDGIWDERVVLSNTIATLKDSSEQKQKYETAYYEAEAASRAKSAFLSSMSHDIRTPMNAVIGMTAIALKHTDEPDYVRDCLLQVQTSSKYLLDIINNVLDMSRIESGRIPLAEEPVYLPELVDGIMALIKPSLEAKAQTLELDVSGVKEQAFLGDSIRLSQIFINILSNSVKFTPSGGRIGLKICQADSDDAELVNYVFTFSDTGIGMSQEFVGQVFDTFSRASGSESSKVEGTGLGMAIAKNLVELMGGKISCDSTLGSVTTFNC